MTLTDDLHASTALTSTLQQRITITRPDDWHVHLREGVMLQTVLPFTATHFGRGIVMPNLVPPITTVAQAEQYRSSIFDLLPIGINFVPLMTAYLTDDIDPDELERGFYRHVFYGAKLYPAHATTNSAHGVKDIRAIRRVLERMEKIGMPLLMHGEVTDPKVDIFDREAVFLDQILQPLTYEMPGLKIVMEHITTKEAVQFVEDGPSTLAATITAHHLVINRNALFAGGLRPHAYCLPVAKREIHRLALRKAAVSGNPKFFLGTDTAPHPVSDKEKDCGCAGIFSAPVALAVYTQVFEEEGALEHLNAFASKNGPAFYSLPENEDCLTLERKPWQVPHGYRVPGGNSVRPFLAGETLAWQVAK